MWKKLFLRIVAAIGLVFLLAACTFESNIEEFRRKQKADKEIPPVEEIPLAIIFSSIAEFETWLYAQPENTADAPYNVALKVDDLGGDYSTNGSLGSVLKASENKFVSLDLSGCTFTSIPRQAFGGVYFGSNVTGIPPPYYSLVSITIPDSVTSIGEQAFACCFNLASVTIPNSVTSIGNTAFALCNSLAAITIPDSVTSIGDSTFRRCSSLESVTIPDSVTSIGDSTFRECRSLESVTIPDGITGIGNYAFQGCSNLASITIPDSITSIGHYAFDGCSSLAAIEVGSNNSAYSSVDGVLYNKEKTIVLLCPQDKTGTVTIPDSVTSIGSSAYDGSSAFQGCSRLTAIEVESNNAAYSSVDGVLYNKEKTVALLCPQGKTGTVTIPDSVIGISYNAFESCTSLTNVTIPDTVIYISYTAFYNCTNLTSVTFEGTILSYDFADYYHYYQGGDWPIITTTFDGDLRAKFYATDADNGTPGTYTRTPPSYVWTKQ
jgi:hypothetical protein